MAKSNTRKTNETEKHVGSKIRDRRIMLGLTQQGLADAIGVTYQQAHKYEKGINRISASRLLLIAQTLGTSVDYFFEGLDSNTDSLDKKERLSLEIARNFLLIKDQRRKDALSNLARVLSVKD